MKTKTNSNSDYVHITVLLDRTGSMEPIRDDTIGGFNAFLKRQQAEPGKATLTLVQFDSQDPYEVIHAFKPIAEVPPLTRKTYVPRANTPLLDAMGRGIADLESRLADLSKDKRPGRVVMVIITDGQENASSEYSQAQVKKMIKARQTQDDWQFVFLSADLAAIGDAIKTGIHACSTLAFAKNGAETREVWDNVSERLSNYRSRKANQVEFDASDRSRQARAGRGRPTGKTREASSTAARP